MASLLSLRLSSIWPVAVDSTACPLSDEEKTLAEEVSLIPMCQACLFRRKTSQVVSHKMRMENMNCSRKNILCFTVFG